MDGHLFFPLHFLQEISVVLSSGKSIWVFSSLPLLANGECALEKWFCLCIFTLRCIELCQATQGVNGTDVLTVYDLPERHGSLQVRLCLRISALKCIELPQASVHVSYAAAWGFQSQFPGKFSLEECFSYSIGTLLHIELSQIIQGVRLLTYPLLQDHQALLEECFGLPIVTLLHVESSEMLKRACYTRMVRVPVLPHRHGSLKEWFRFPVAILPHIDLCKIDETVSHVQVFWTKQLLPDLKGALEERLRFLVATLFKRDISEPVETVS